MEPIKTWGSKAEPSSLPPLLFGFSTGNRIKLRGLRGGMVKLNDSKEWEGGHYGFYGSLVISRRSGNIRRDFCINFGRDKEAWMMTAACQLKIP